MAQSTRVVRPGDTGYDALRSGFNFAVEHRPEVIVDATSPADVVAAVRLAARVGRPVAVMNTGHGPSVPADGGVLVRTGRMNRVDVDRAAPPRRRRVMRIGIGLPAAVHGVDATTIGDWAAEGEQAGFASVGVIDRLVYDNLEPLTALAAAAARTEHVELLTTVLNVGWRANPVLLAKQMASVDLLSGGRLTAGLGLGGWPEDFEASEVPTSGGGARLDATLATMRQAWAGELSGQGGPMRRLADGRPALLFGGLVPAAYTRAATQGQGWVAPLMGLQLLETGATAVRQIWAEAGRAGEPRIVTGRYFSLGQDADRGADAYLRHYYGDDGFAMARPDTLTSPQQLRDELDRLTTAGVTDLVLYPSSSDPDQVRRVADAVRASL